jgi:glycosyltransferase involved in cell wall biosynthesis
MEERKSEMEEGPNENENSSQNSSVSLAQTKVLSHTMDIARRERKTTRTKILFVITKSTLGGAQRYVFDIMSNLNSSDYTTAAVVGGNGPLIDMIKSVGLRVYPLKNLKRDISFFSEIAAFFALCRILRTQRPDVLHLNSSKAGLLGALAGRICRVPQIVFTAHGWAFNEDRPVWQKFILKTLHWCTILLSHKTIAVAEGMKKQMDWPWVQKKMVVIYNGRSLPNLKYKDEARGILEMNIQNTDARLIDYHDDLWMGSLSELHPIKRVDRAITAVAALVREFPTLRYIIVHDGELRTKLQQQVHDLSLEEHVFFTGAIEEAARLLPAFDIFVLPSKSEAFPYVIVEAGAATVPVVATNVGGIPDVIDDGINGLLVPPDDTPALTKALRRLLSDERLRNDLAYAHHNKMKSFTVERMLAETIAVYES